MTTATDNQATRGKLDNLDGWPSLKAYGADPNGWKRRHNDAVIQPHYGHERALVLLCEALREWALASKSQSDCLPAEDYVLGPEWLAIAKAISGLLDGPAGNRLDMGTLSGFLHDTIKAAGFEDGLDT